jgi:hypothetical protein
MTTDFGAFFRFGAMVFVVFFVVLVGMAGPFRVARAARRFLARTVQDEYTHYACGAEPVLGGGPV